MSYKKSNWVPYDPTLSFEQNVTQGGTTTADKLNNMETGIDNAFDKTSDTVGVRNYVLNTGVPYVATGDGTSSQQFLIYSIAQDIPMTNDLWVSFDLSVANPDGGTFQMEFDGNNNKNGGYICGYGNGINLTSGHYSYRYGYRNNANPINNGIYFYIQNSKATVTISNLCVSLGDAIADWVPAPEDKVTDNKDGSITVNGVQIQPFNKLSDTIGGRNLLPGTSGTLQTVTNASWYNSGLPSITPVVTTIDSDTIYTARAWVAPASHDVQVQVVWTDSSGTTYYSGGNTISAGTSGYSTMTITLPAGSTVQRVTIVFTTAQSTPSTVSYKEMKFEQGSIATPWTPAPEDKVNVSDMRKPASDVAGIEEVNAKQDAIGYTPADDSKVAHLSGTNNFDTAPTVNNNPVATTDDVTTASNTVLTSANTSISKLLQSSSNNDEDSAVTNSTSDTSNFYYWTE